MSKDKRKEQRRKAKALDRKQHREAMIRRYPQLEGEATYTRPGFRPGHVPPELMVTKQEKDDDDDMPQELPTFVTGQQ